MKQTKILILILFVLISVNACISQEPDYESPQGIKYMSLEKLEQITYDIHIADAMVSTNVLRIDETNRLKDTLIYESIFIKYGCTREQFEQTLLFYTHAHTDSLSIMYDRILEKLNTKTVENK